MYKPEYEVRVYEYSSGVYIRRATTYACVGIKYTESFYTPGSFELIIPLGAKYADEFKKGRFVEIGRHVYGRVSGVEYNAGNNADTLTVSGCDLKGLMRQRVTIPPGFATEYAMAGYDGIQGPSETVMKHFVASNAVLTSAETRRVPGLEIAPDQGRGIPDDKYLSRYEPLDAVLQKVGTAAELGYSCVLEPEDGRILFDVVKGVQRPLVISLNRGTTMSMRYTDDDSGLRNAFYTTMSGAEFADEALTMVYYRDGEDAPSGFDRAEMHMTVGADHPTPGEEYNELRRIALINAADYAGLVNFTCDINPAKAAYRKDYNLGDYVTVQNMAWGVTMPAQIVSVAVEYRGDGESYAVQFGTQKPSLINTIKKAVKE